MVTPETMEAEEKALRLEVDDDGLAWLVLDRPDSRVNLLTAGLMQRLDDALGEVEEAAATGRIKALILRSAKPGNFIAGADIEQIREIRDPVEGGTKAAQGQRIFLRLERLPVPTVAAIRGACLGGGAEMVLACRYRVAADTPETRIGLPEVRLGIIPGFGGTVRLPRLVGLRSAVELIVTGRAVSARSAERMGLVDERVPAAGFEARVRRFAWERIGAGRASRRRRRSLPERLLDETAPGRRLVLWQARRRVLAETRGHYPAPLAALDTIRDTMALPLEQALEREAEALGRLIATDVSKNLIHVFDLSNAARKAATATGKVPERIAVVGAGLMGGAIAQLAAYRGLHVRLKDIREDALGQGLRHARELFDGLVRRGRLSRKDADFAMNRIAPTLEYAGFGTAELVLEAVVERQDIKEQVLREVESRVGPDCILASNTSSLSITGLQAALQRPERFCGLHFFNPAHRMPLVEVIRGDRTSDEAVAGAFALARRLEKTALIVNDGPGFLVNRILAPYLNEAGWLLADGASIEEVDRALLGFGMPMGPFRLLDEIGLDVARHAGAVMHEAFGDRMRPAPVLSALEAASRPGRKGGVGFYRYRDGKERGVDPSVYDELGDAVPPARRSFGAEEIVDRLILVMINEAARALEDGIVADAGAVDLGMIMGTGFPPFRGGLLRYADARGVGRILERLEALAGELGARYEAANGLRERAAAGRGFY